ncbi:MAG: hypothetical protein J7K62_00580 [Thermoplasmata archaeon]|nr:hypothetical protein [Thermoplasmata archaeon]
MEFCFSRFCCIRSDCSKRCIFVSIDADIIKELTTNFPYYYKEGKIPANTYKEQDYDVTTVQVGNDVVINKDVDENIA